MGRRLVLVGMAAGAIASVCGCASGDGSPKANVQNDLPGCLVEAEFLGYHFSTPVGTGGRTETREVKDGASLAYAVIADPVGDCYQTATLEDVGQLYVTNAPQRATAGDTTTVVFSSANAQLIPTCSPEYFQGLFRFNRLPDCD